MLLTAQRMSLRRAKARRDVCRGRVLLIALAVSSGACATSQGVAHPAAFPGAPAPPIAASSGPAVAPEMPGRTPPSSSSEASSAVASAPIAGTVLTSAPAALTSAVVDSARAQLGAKYRLGGDTPKTGFDCSGLVQYAFAQAHVAVPRTTAEQFAVGQRVPVDRIEAGDLIFFQTIAPGASHVGIALSATEFIHAPTTGSPVRIDRVDATYWRTRLVGVRRVGGG